MLTAYYSRGCDSRELFSGLKITEAPDFDTYRNEGTEKFCGYLKCNLAGRARSGGVGNGAGAFRDGAYPVQ